MKEVADWKQFVCEESLDLLGQFAKLSTFWDYIFGRENKV